MRLDGGRLVDAWLGGQPPERRVLLYRALFAIVEGTWPAYPNWDDAARRTIALEFAPGEVIVWRRYAEYPDWFRVVYVGPL